MRKLLVALDSSPLRSHVLGQALSLAKPLKAVVMLQHVLTPNETGSPDLPGRSYTGYYPILDESSWKIYQERWQAFEEASLQRLRDDALVARQAEVETEFTQTAGEPAHAICDLARTWDADLIIVGSRGRTGLSELLLGSVSNYVMHHAPCSVMVVHSNDDSHPATTAKLAETATTT